MLEYVQYQRETLFRLEGNDLTIETSSIFLVTEIKVLLKWKMDKVPPGNKHALIGMYLQLPSPLEDIPWLDKKERELHGLYTTDIDMKETVVAISTK